MFRPSRPLPNRLVRLGVVLDRRNSPERVRMIARMCELAGLDALWVRDDDFASPGDNVVDAWSALLLAARETQRTRLGAMLNLATRGWDGLEALLHSSETAEIASRLEITVSGPPASADTANRVRQSIAPAPVVGLEVRTPDDMRAAARAADDAVFSTTPAQAFPTRAADLASACLAEGRQPRTLGVAIQLPVSIGRTETEAQARVEHEPLFAGNHHPAVSGIFGTLEMCQDRVIELAHAGVTDLRCVVPNSPDVHDVIAQLTAMVIGSVDILQPGAPRSRAPDAPSEWGGRPRYPTWR